MHDMRSTPMQLTEDTQDRETCTAGQDTTDLAECAILAMPRSTTPRPITDMQRWLDMCG